MSSSPYSPAAQLLTQIWTRRKSLKTVAYDKKGTLKCTKATYAQVCHVLESKATLDRVLERDRSTLKVRNEGLLYVLLYELLLGPNRSIRGGGSLKRELLTREEDLRRILKEIQLEQGSKDGKQGIGENVLFPRYIRVNTLQTTMENAISSLQETEQGKVVYADAHVPQVLVLPPKTQLHGDSKLVESGKIVLQDKSSCFSALCLVRGNDELLNGDYLDACAAPGNKTSHLAALVSDVVVSSSSKKKRQRTVHALDRSSSRLSILQRRMDQLVPSNHPHVRVENHHLDFLKATASQFPSVRAILLDPSCSGSGIFSSPDRHGEELTQDTTDTPDPRIASLSNFQLVALQHAMSSFPKVERIVYSTCSLHNQENECVVSQALQAHPEWKIVAPKCLQGWERRGREVAGLTQEQAQCLIRADRGDDTNGFFVCYLERVREEKSATERKIKSPLPSVLTPPKGIQIYNGEFRSNTNSKSKLKPTKDPKTARATQTPTKEHKPSKHQVTATTAKSDQKPHKKKRDKKIAWKRRQMEQKLRRLQEKEQKRQDAASTPKPEHAHDKSTTE